MPDTTFNRVALPLGIPAEFELMNPMEFLGAGQTIAEGEVSNHPVELVAYPGSNCLVLHFGSAENPDASYRLSIQTLVNDLEAYIERKGGLHI